MNTQDKTSSNPVTEKSPSFFQRINLRFPWLKLVTVCFIGLVAVLDLLDLTISKTADLSDNFPTAPMAKHVKATERDLEGKKLVALTFDDGPSPTTTPRLLDILAEKNTPVTFFVLGRMARNYPDIISRMQKTGHEVANHTMYHQNLPRISVQSIQDDFNESNAVIGGILGHRPTLMRPPYGNINDAVRSLSGAPLILWSVDTLDWKDKNTDAIMSKIYEQVYDGAIILMHDIHPTSVDAVPTIIDALRNEGYEFATVSEIAKIRGIDLAPGQSYFSFRP